ncbi:hypothetical protein D3C81_1594200 [compost metagenome]
MYRLTEQNDQRRQAVEPETRRLPGDGQAIELSGHQQAEQQHPQKVHPQVDEQAQRAPEQYRHQAAQQGRAEQFLAGVAGVGRAALLAETDRFHDDWHVTGRVNHGQQEGWQHHQSGAHCQPTAFGGREGWLGFWRGSTGGLWKQKVADRQRRHGQEQSLDQGDDHLKRQAEFSGSG